MKRSILAIIFCVVLNETINSQSINLNNSLPIDFSIKKGVLSNGLTYYIKNTDVVKDAASYYIIQNVGSILENDEQQGLAHFLEHMAFNGTENFPGKNILDILQKHGAVFGKDINAYTSFDETVYNLNNIPTKDSLVDACLTILKDWSNYLLLTDEEIDAERGVIKEEWRTRQNGQNRASKSIYPVAYNYSKYANRMPIGLMSVVEKFDYKSLRDFYHDWYRTDLQAIAIIGDVNVKEVEQKIIEKFSDIPAVENPKHRYVIDIPNNDEILYSLGTDPEVTTTKISFGIRHKKELDIETVSDLKRSLLETMVMNMLSERISEKTQNPETNYLEANIGYWPMTRTTNALNMVVSPKPNRQKEAFKEVLIEVVRAVKYGFLQTEVERAITKLAASYENQISKINNRSHRQIEGVMQSNFLSNSTMTDIEKEFNIAKQIFSTLTPKDFHNTIQRLYSKKNRYINVIGVENEENLSENSAKSVLLSVENDTNLKPYTEDLDGKTLVSGLNIIPGSIKDIENHNEINSNTYTLSNGIKVHYKFVDKENDKVSINAISYGGLSLLNDEELPSASFVGNLVQMSGLGDFTESDLKKVLAGKTANVRIGINDISETLNGNSNTKDVETMLQLIHTYFVKPRFDTEAYKVLESNIDNYLLKRSKNIGEIMRDSLTVTLYGKNNLKKRIFNQDYANDISFDKIKEIYQNRFADASDFEFFIVGDVKEKQLKPLLENYLACLPTKNTKEMYIDNSSEWISNKINKDIYLTMKDPKARVNIVYKKEIPYTKSNEIFTNSLGDILQLRVTETVREAEGGAYSPRANANLTRQPKSEIVVSFNFDCNPDMADKLVNIVNTEIQKMANGEINEVDLNKIKTNLIKEHQQAKNKNEYYMQLLLSYFRYNEKINDSKNFENIVNNMTKKDIQEIANTVLEDGKSYEVVFKPKQ